MNLLFIRFVRQKNENLSEYINSEVQTNYIPSFTIFAICKFQTKFHDRYETALHPRYDAEKYLLVLYHHATKCQNTRCQSRQTELQLFQALRVKMKILLHSI